MHYDDMDCNMLREQMYSFDLDSKYADSFPDGLNEEHRFLPNIEIPIRRTNSLDDISRFYRYFHLLQTNKGMLFTWKHYLKILQDQLKNFETLTILNKAMLTFISNISLDQTGYFTPETGYSSSQERTPSTTIPKKLIFDDSECTSSAEDGSSVITGSNTKNIHKSRLLKKICLEMRSLAQNISKFVDVIGHLPENCSECGVALDIQKYKQQCQHVIEGVGDTVDCSKHNKIKDKKKKSLSFMSISSVFSVRSSRGEGELTSKLKVGKSNTPKKGSLKHFASLCSKYVRRV
ncbi:uncharacterized protein LOC129965423 isoform X2 [Argiope bruennichi]|uniref:uncharacterized protein LOC129965423 isoform X2 n=1 Tax=Argiope bruennichi TaxID=94029 RepID=UPI00249552E7|nr:uncharacterized protein LOC129965423 isoform X2 [Argiope bruennichi]